MSHTQPHPVAPMHTGPGVRMIIAMVWLYRRSLAWLIGGQCRYQPTCSQYMIDAVHKYGAMRGFFRGVRRIGRCHPFHEGGYDPA